MDIYLRLIQLMANKLEDGSIGAISELRRELRGESPELLGIFEAALVFEGVD